MGNYEVKPEDLTTITTSTGLGYSSEPVRGNGGRLQTEHMALQGNHQDRARTTTTHRDRGWGTVATG